MLPSIQQQSTSSPLLAELNTSPEQEMGSSTQSEPVGWTSSISHYGLPLRIFEFSGTPTCKFPPDKFFDTPMLTGSLFSVASIPMSTSTATSRRSIGLEEPG